MANNFHPKKKLKEKDCVKSVRIWSYSGPHFPAFVVSLRIQSKCGKMRTRITPNTDTFYTVKGLKSPWITAAIF